MANECFGTARTAKAADGFAVELAQPSACYQITLIDNLFEAGNAGLENTIKSIDRNIAPSDVLIIVDDGLPPDRRQAIRSWCRSRGFAYQECLSGEGAKTFENIEKLAQVASAQGITRRGLIVGVGGGAVLDAVGSVAMLYRRSIRYVRVPTTLLGQIDAGVGIKVGFNLEKGKNVLGGFYPPSAVLTDLTFLADLNAEQRRAGLAEILKVAIVADEGLFEMIETYGKEIVAGGNIGYENLRQLVKRSIYVLLRLLAPDMFELDPRRPADFGHELAHPLEEASAFAVSHGDAVAIGILVSSTISQRRGLIGDGDYARIARIFADLRFPNLGMVQVRELCRKVIVHTTCHKGRLLYVLPSAIGACTIVDDITWQELEAACLHAFDRKAAA